MDPDACLKAIREADQDGHADEAAYLRTELRKWIRSGGFKPSDPQWRELVGWV